MLPFRWVVAHQRFKMELAPRQNRPLIAKARILHQLRKVSSPAPQVPRQRHLLMGGGELARTFLIADWSTNST